MRKLSPDLAIRLEMKSIENGYWIYIDRFEIKESIWEEIIIY